MYGISRIAMAGLLAALSATVFGACAAIEIARAQEPQITYPPAPPVFNPSSPYTVPQPPYSPASPARSGYLGGSDLSLPVARSHRRAVTSSSRVAKANVHEIPALRVEQLCRATSTENLIPLAAEGDPKAAFDQCMQSERSYREQLAKEWAKFSQADKQHCVSLVQMGGSASYAELITCLEMARDVRQSKSR